MYIPRVFTSSKCLLFSLLLQSTNLNRFVERYFYNETPIPFPYRRFPTIESLAEAALKKLSSRSICNTTQLSTGAIIPPVEAVYQDAFFKALNDVLGFASRVSSEWSPTGKGRIDFRLLDVPWGFELLPENNRISEHCERFTDGGSYRRWVAKGWLQDWLIINFCTSFAKTYGKSPSHIHFPNTNPRIRCTEHEVVACCAFG